MPGTQRARLFAVLAVLIGTCGALAMLAFGELAVRLGTDTAFLGTSANLFTPDRFEDSRGNTPNVLGFAFHEPAYTDDNGFRVPGRDYQYPNAPTGRILVVGDSVAFGPGVPEQETFVGQLRAWKPRWTVYNSAVMGYGFDDYLNVVRTLLPKERYDLVVLIVCLNDVSAVSGMILNHAAAVHPSRNGSPPPGNPPAPREAANASPPAKDLAVARPMSIVERIRGIPLAVAANDWLREHSKLYLFLRGIVTDPAARYFLADHRNYDTDVDQALASLLATADEVHRAGIPMLIVVSPYEYQLRAPEDITSTELSGADVMLPQTKIKAFLTDHGVASFDSADFFRSQDADSGTALFLPFDPMHFSAEGHTVMFWYLRRLIESQNLMGIAGHM
jgi:lysophospholipase L1-like esterase